MRVANTGPLAVHEGHLDGLRIVVEQDPKLSPRRASGRSLVVPRPYGGIGERLVEPLEQAVLFQQRELPQGGCRRQSLNHLL